MGTSLSDLAAALRVIHRALLHSARDVYEAEHGPIPGPFALLHLASTHPDFAFLRPLSEYMVDLDMLLEEDEGATEPAQAAAQELRALLGLHGEDAPLANRYRDLLQRSPEFVIEHARLLEVLRNLPARDEQAALLHDRHQWAEVRRHRHPDTASAATLGGGWLDPHEPR